MGTITYEGALLRKNGYALLGEGCKSCSSRSKCFSDTCHRVKRFKYEGCTDLMSDYLTFTKELKIETYVREYKYGYALITNGEVYASGKYEPGWCIRFYNGDRTTKSYSTTIPNNEIITKGNKRFIYCKGLKKMYGIKDLIPLQDSKFIMLY